MTSTVSPVKSTAAPGPAARPGPSQSGCSSAAVQSETSAEPRISGAKKKGKAILLMTKYL